MAFDGTWNATRPVSGRSIDDAAGYTDANHQVLAYSAAPKGVPGSELDGGQRDLLRSLLGAYFGRVPDSASPAPGTTAAHRVGQHPARRKPRPLGLARPGSRLRPRRADPAQGQPSLDGPSSGKPVTYQVTMTPALARPGATTPDCCSALACRHRTIRDRLGRIRRAWHTEDSGSVSRGGEGCDCAIAALPVREGDASLR
jgi:hypothetical protein